MLGGGGNGKVDWFGPDSAVVALVRISSRYQGSNSDARLDMRACDAAQPINLTLTNCYTHCLSCWDCTTAAIKGDLS